jgi:hypothetical protein
MHDCCNNFYSLVYECEYSYALPFISFPLLCASRILLSHKCKLYVELTSDKEPHLAYGSMEPVEAKYGDNGHRHAPAILFLVKQSLLPHRTGPRGVVAERNHKKVKR